VQVEAAEAKENELFRSLKMQLKLKTEMLKHVQAQNKSASRAARSSGGGSPEANDEDAVNKADDNEAPSGAQDVRHSQEQGTHALAFLTHFHEIAVLVCHATCLHV
jgi:hypothetical protein